MSKEVDLDEVERVDQEDRCLLERVTKKDEAAFDELYVRYQGLVYSTIHQVLQDFDDTLEVMQEVFHSIWKRASTYNEKSGRPITWIAAISRNRAIDRVRSRQRQGKLRGAIENEKDFRSFVWQQENADDFLSRRDRVNHLIDALDHLTPMQREAVEKVYLQGLTHQEFADELGEPIGTVKARVRRGVMSLKRNLSAGLMGA